MKQKLLIFLLIVLLIAGACILTDGFDFGPKERISYPEFIKKLDAGKINSVKVFGDRLEVTEENGQAFRTDNPNSSDFKERLLSAGVMVTETERTQDQVTFWLDILFDAIFFGAAAFGIYKLIHFYRDTFRVVRHTGVHFEDIAGMDAIKREMGLIVNILKDPTAYQKKGIRPIKGIILEGPPGNGKTLFAKALAEETDVKFIATKGADFQSALMSMGANKIKMLFGKARRNKPCIIFIDEFDSIGERRNYAGSGIDKENNRIITTMLNEMDGFSGFNGILVIAATNSYTSLDPALIRPGRFDLKYNIGNPDAETRYKLIELYSKGKVLDASLSKDMLVKEFEGLSCAAVEAIFNEASAIAAMEAMEGNVPIRHEHILSAAVKTDSKLKKSGK